MLLSWFELLQLDLHLDLLQVSLFKQLCQFLDLFLACLRHQMNKDTYPAETANLDCSLDTTERGFSIEVKGINDKLEILLQTVLNHFEAFEDNLEDNHFEALLKQQKKDYYNRLIDPSNLTYDVIQFIRRNVYR